MSSFEDTQTIRARKKSGKTSDDYIQAVCFRLADDDYGIDVSMVEKIIRLPEIHEAEGLPPFSRGTMTCRGKEIPLVDLRARLGCPPAEIDGETRVAVLDIDDKIFGVIVDSVIEVLRMETSMIDDSREISSEPGMDVLKGIYRDDDNTIKVLDCTRLFDL